MAVNLQLTDEQAKWLSKHIETLESDWHWNNDSRSKDPDDMEHARTIKQKTDAQLRLQTW